MKLYSHFWHLELRVCFHLHSYACPELLVSAAHSVAFCAKTTTRGTSLTAHLLFYVHVIQKKLEHFLITNPSSAAYRSNIAVVLVITVEYCSTRVYDLQKQVRCVRGSFNVALVSQILCSSIYKF